MAAGIITGILTAFAILQAAAPLLELLLTYLAKYMAQNAQTLWADKADQNLAAAAEAANRIVSQVTIDPVTALNHVSQMWPTQAALEKAFPGICQSIMARHILMQDVPGTSHGMAAKLVEGAHAQMTMTAAEKKGA
jgi:hypothetical protein